MTFIKIGAAASCDAAAPKYYFSLYVTCIPSMEYSPEATVILAL